MEESEGDTVGGGVGGEKAAWSQSSVSSGSSSGCGSSEGAEYAETVSPAEDDFRRRSTAVQLQDFDLVRRIGGGDIGKVYLCKLRRCRGDEYYAMKVVDKEEVMAKKKARRAEMEVKILKMVDHPFLPTLHSHFEDSRYSCVVMDFCSGGDLHRLRHLQPLKRFSVDTARFYAAEVLMALEYLHMMGIVYRDLKPENVLVRSDGHIMLSDFDLSLCSTAVPSVESPSFSTNAPSCSSPLSARAAPSLLPCLPLRLFSSGRVQTLSSAAAGRVFVAEPVTARSFSFVGTHEYVSPEVASGKEHGSAVDWWAFGVFIYEMVYGVTPFAGASNEATLRNIVKKPVGFPTAAPASEGEEEVRRLIGGLLIKDANRRLGSKMGAAEVKRHEYFSGMNLALVRSYPPPEVHGRRLTKTWSCPFTLKKNQHHTPFDCF